MTSRRRFLQAAAAAVASTIVLPELPAATPPPPPTPAPVEATTCRGLYVGIGGDVAVVDAQGQDLVFKMPGGVFLPVRVTRIKALGTTAGGIVAL